MKLPRSRLFWTVGTVSALAVAVYLHIPREGLDAHAATQPAAPPPTPVTVATVEARDVATFEEFSGRLEAIERVEIRARVSGTVDKVHFREGSLVKAGDLLITIDPAPYQAEVARAEAQLAAAQARVVLTKREFERAQQLNSTAISQSTVDQRANAFHEAEANVRAAQAQLQTAKLNLDWTSVRAPVAGKVGKLEITVGNLIAAGPGAPVLTTLVSVNPIYASFDADEQLVLRTLKSLPKGADIDQVPVLMQTAQGDEITGKLQLLDNQVNVRSGTVRVRAIFPNEDGRLLAGQFARLKLGQPTAEPALLISERAIGTDQAKKFVLVVGDDNKANYREVTLGANVGGLRMINDGLKPGERVVVNGMQRVCPGAVVAPQSISMDKAEAPNAAQSKS
jgi:membrane fusion protein, multidrug efflux system